MGAILSILRTFFGKAWGFLGLSVPLFLGMGVDYFRGLLSKSRLSTAFRLILNPIVKTAIIVIFIAVFKGFFDLIMGIYSAIKNVLEHINSLQTNGNQAVELATNIANSIGFFKAMSDVWTILAPLYVIFFTLFITLLLGKSYQFVSSIINQYLELGSGVFPSSNTFRRGK